METVLELFKKEQEKELFAWEKKSARLAKEFVQDYPVDAVEDLSLYDYLIAREGTGNPHSFCRRLRYDLQTVCSMGNAWPDCFGIYFSGNGNRIALSRTFSKMFDDDFEAAFKYIKHEIRSLLDAAAVEDIPKIKKCKLNSLFKYKLISVYYPDRYVPVCTKSALEGYCNAVGVPYNNEDEMIYGIISLREWKESAPYINRWSNAMMMAFCDWLWNNEKKTNVSELQKNPYIEKAKEIEAEIDRIPITGQSREAIIKVRVNQGVFRDLLLKRYGKCCLCGVRNAALLNASHIKPWRDCLPEEKLDIDNGFLLCPNHDRLFDKGFISFADDGTILISDYLNHIDCMFTNVDPSQRIVLTEKNKEYLAYHREKIFQKA